MALKIDKSRTVHIVDRTLPEIFSATRKISRLGLIDFSWMLAGLGVDLIEINSPILDRMGKMPAGIEFLYRLESWEDIQQCLHSHVKNCILHGKMLFSAENLENLKRHHIKIFAEFKADKTSQIYSLRRLKNLSCLHYIDEIRVTGLNGITSFSWLRAVKAIEKVLNKKVDICPENRYYNATALAVEGIMNGAGSISLTFTGVGGSCGYAALEEVITAAKILINPRLKVDLSNLPEIGRRFSEISKSLIHPNKPVLGSGIFKYESGIHADGIEKNPDTYEPFEPETVGQKRTLCIGKHSGRKSLMNKLEGLEIYFEEDELPGILEDIREKSIELKRELFDSEIIALCKEKIWM